MESLNALDASFLAIEDAVDHMCISSVGIFEGPPPGPDELREFIAGKLPLVPRYRQKVLVAPLAIGRPVWVDDPHFRLDYHLRRSALPSPGSMSELRALVGRVMSQQLDRHKPLWETWVIEGMDHGRWALLSKTHHCMVDGVAGTDLVSVVLDTDRAPAPCLPDDWRPEPEPSPLRLALHSLRGLATAPFTRTVDLLGTLRSPVAIANDVRQALAVGSIAARLAHAAPSSSLTGPIGPHRRWCEVGVRLDDVKAVRVRLGGTVNDVVLAMATSGLRDLLIARGEPTADRTIRTLVPVSVRPPEARGVLDNRVAALFADLPVGIDDPVERLAMLRAQMNDLKQSGQAQGAQAVVAITSLLPATAAALAARFVVHQQHSTETVVTNVHGPQVPLYVLGRRMLEAYPYVPLAGKIRVGVAVWSYDGGLYFGVTGDQDAAPDVDVVAAGIARGLEDLEHAAAAA